MKPLNHTYRTVTSLFRQRPKEIGLPPGTLIHVGEKKAVRTVLSHLDYDEEQFSRREDVAVDECLALKNRRTVGWTNVAGLHEIDQIEKIGREFKLHPLLLEDILNTDHPPKFEEFENAALIVVKLFSFDQESCSIDAEQISLVLTPDKVLTFQERSGAVFDSVRKRLERKSGRIRQRGADYLAYALLDAVVDSYFHILEKVGERLDFLETELIEHPSHERLKQVHRLKGQLIFLRKNLWPMRELTGSLLHSESTLLEDQTNVFLRDLHDHGVQVLDLVESYRENASGLIDLYMSSVSQRMNEVMQVLTIMASIFIPLTFIAGIYGMNFEYMPELKWRYGYPLAWGLMGACGVAMLWFFKRKKWF